MGPLREGRWDCDACGKRGIRGLERVCPGCGQPRPQNVRFYLPQEAPEITDAGALREARAGPDWYCEHCGAGNSDLRTTCKQCGAAKGTSPSHRVTEYVPDEVPRSGDEAPQPVGTEAGPSNGRAGPPVAAAQRSGWRKPGVLAAVAGALLLVSLLLYLLLRSPFTSVAVSGFSWQRSIAVEQLRTLTEQGWSVPPGARPISETRAVSTYENVVDHYETRQRQACETVREGAETEEYQDCEQVQSGTETYVCGVIDRGNGAFEDKICERPVYERRCVPATRQVPKYVKKCHDEMYQAPVYRQEPRYATRYTYEIDRWTPDRTLRAGEQNHEPAWPALQLAANEREGERTESYTVTFTNKGGRSYSYKCGLEEWSSFREAQRLQIKVAETGVVIRR